MGKKNCALWARKVCGQGKCGECETNNIKQRILLAVSTFISIPHFFTLSIPLSAHTYMSTYLANSLPIYHYIYPI